jgi:hypothetical protein
MRWLLLLQRRRNVTSSALSVPLPAITVPARSMGLTLHPVEQVSVPLPSLGLGMAEQLPDQGKGGPAAGATEGVAQVMYTQTDEIGLLGDAAPGGLDCSDRLAGRAGEQERA